MAQHVHFQDRLIHADGLDRKMLGADDAVFLLLFILPVLAGIIPDILIDRGGMDPLSSFVLFLRIWRPSALIT